MLVTPTGTSNLAITTLSHRAEITLSPASESLADFGLAPGLHSVTSSWPSRSKWLLHLPVPYTIDERVGGLYLNKGNWKPNKGSVCQLLYSCCELLQRLTACLHPGLH